MLYPTIFLFITHICYFQEYTVWKLVSRCHSSGFLVAGKSMPWKWLVRYNILGSNTKKSRSIAKSTIIKIYTCAISKHSDNFTKNVKQNYSLEKVVEFFKKIVSSVKFAQVKFNMCS